MNTITIHFSAPTIKSLIDRLKEAFDAGDVRSARQLWALLNLGDGRSVAESAHQLSLCPQTLYRWLRAFLLQGVEALGYRKAPGRPPKLSKTQKRRLAALLDAGPQAAGYPNACWSSQLLQHLIQRTFGVLYSRHYICQLLHNLGFSYQKARFVSDHLDEQARRDWLSITWPQLFEQAQQSGAMMLFADEASFAQWGSLSYTWAPRGHQPTVKTTGKPKGSKVFGAIEYRTGRFFSQAIEARFSSATYQQFLTSILTQTQQPLILIHDGARYHTSAAMKQFYQTHQHRLRVVQLPSYSPDYNPIEYLWKKLKAGATHNQYFPAFEDLIASVNGALEYFRSHPQEISTLVGPYLKSLDYLPEVN